MHSIRTVLSCAGACFFAAFTTAVLADDARLANLSTRGQVGTGGDIMISGFVIGPGSNKTVLIRAVGPTLANFGLSSVLADPTLALFNSAGVQIASNDNWSTPIGTTPVDAATFSSVGAFVLPANSKDAALIASNLAPGGYTAQVSGFGNTTGLALIELYEMGATAASSKLVNISTRALVGTGATVMIPGLVIAPGSGTRKLLIRAAGPALTPFGVSNALADPTITVVNGAGVAVATNDNWSTPVDTASADATVLAGVYTQAGAFAFPAGSKDAAVLADFAPGSYTVQVSGVNNTTGVALVEVYDVTPSSGAAVVSVASTKSSADESGSNPGEFTITRSGDTSLPLTVSYGMSGTASNAFDYVNLSGTVTIPAGAPSVKIALTPLPDVQTEGTEAATLNLVAGNGYTVGAQASATVTIADSAATLYVATLRPEGGANSSTASGTATILLSASGTVASVSVTFTNLSSAEVSGHLRIGPSGDFVFNLPAGQVTSAEWNFTPTGNYTAASLLDALKNGNIYVGIDTASFPGGELRGTFIAGTGSQSFSAPAAAAAVSLTNVTAIDAARFLTQTTFGPKRSEIDALTGGSIAAWIDAQLALPFTSHRAATIADRTAFGGSPSVTNWNAIHPQNRSNAWFKNAITAPDQLRQRVAFALSQIFVVSDVSLGDDSRAEPLANYYDILGNGAFGNFRTLLENVTLSPMMAEYLSLLRNSKADPTTGTTPDENYAREVMQLFTIGLSRLQPDGTLVLGADGLPIPTYNQATITETAKVFTGWAYPSTNLSAFRTASSNYISPLQLFPAFHDDTQKSIVNGVVIPANQGGTKDLQLTLDALFNHPNTGPFISKLLIQRLVTSNPSPAYVYRVAQKFENNGSGVRGDLSAVVRAILTDYEARSPAVVNNLSYGKLREPLLRLVAVLRSLNATSRIGRYGGYQDTLDGVPITSTTPNPGLTEQARTSANSSATATYSLQTALAQAPLRAPTVFNFYLPDYVVPGALANAGLVAPEFQITDDTFSVGVPNLIKRFVIANNTATTVVGNATLVLDLNYELPLLSNLPALFDHLALVLAGGNLPAAVRTRIATALTALPPASTDLDRIQSVVLIIATSPSCAVQK